MFKVTWEEQARKDLKKIDFTAARKIKVRVAEHLAQDPSHLGKPLKGKWRGFHRYRCFDEYRVIYQIKQSELFIIVVRVGNRRDIYD